MSIYIALRKQLRREDDSIIDKSIELSSLENSKYITSNA